MKQYKPMLARTLDAPFSSKDWIFEVKWDGIRAVSYVGKELSIRSRNQKELLYNFPELSELKDLAGNVVLDGEIIVMRDGIADFQTLIERNQKTSARDIEYLAQTFPATYVVFDIVEKDGKSLAGVPLLERKNILKESVKEGKYVIQSIFIEDKGDEYYQAALEKGFEGIMAKKKQSTYEPGIRSSNWLKIKQIKTCDCVIFGYTMGEGSRKSTFGSMILGLYDDTGWEYVGKVGTGFSHKQMEDLVRLFELYKVEEITLNGVDEVRKITWLKPGLVCEVGYQTITREGRLRIPVYRGLKTDKNPLDCTVDQIRPAAVLEDYLTRRDFSRTPEPKGGTEKAVGKSFVIHEHDARRLHYDLRLERDGVLQSWAIPKGPPREPGEKRLAVHTEDHPLEYGTFEGIIPEGQYGAGTVKIWDRGMYEPLVWDDEKIEFIVKGDKLEGRYVLVRFKKAGEKDWLFFKAD